MPPLLCNALFKISKVQFLKSTVKWTSKYSVAAETIEQTFFDDFLTASWCHRCHTRTLYINLMEFHWAQNDIRRQKYRKITKIATTAEEPRTRFPHASNPNRSKTLQIDPQLRPGGPLRPSGTIYGPERLHLATELYRLARPSYFTSKYPTFDLHGPPHTNESQKVRRHRIREGRFGGFPAYRGPFS